MSRAFRNSIPERPKTIKKCVVCCVCLCLFWKKKQEKGKTALKQTHNSCCAWKQHKTRLFLIWNKKVTTNPQAPRRTSLWPRPRSRKACSCSWSRDFLARGSPVAWDYDSARTVGRSDVFCVFFHYWILIVCFLLSDSDSNPFFVRLGRGWGRAEWGVL